MKICVQFQALKNLYLPKEQENIRKLIRFWKEKFWFREKKSAPIPKLSTDIETHIKFRSHTNMGSPLSMVSLSTIPGIVRFKKVLISTNSRYSTIFKNKLFWILDFWTESTEFYWNLFQVSFTWLFFYFQHLSTVKS